MVTMKDIRDVVLQEIEQQFNTYQIQSVGNYHTDPSIEVTAKSGFPVICIDFGDIVEVYRSSDVDDIVRLDASDPNFILTLGEALDYFQVPRK